MKKDLFYKCLSIIAFFSLTLFFSYCIKYGPSPVFVDQGDIGSDGGIVKTNDGASVEIPAGALSTNKTISITNKTGSDSIAKNGYCIYELKPDGLVFSDSVIITLPFDDSYLNLNNELDYGIGVMVFQDTAWIRLRAEIDLTNKVARIKTLHFSNYVIRYPSKWTKYFIQNKNGPKKTINVPYYEQSGNWCGYYSLSMVLKYAGYSFKAPYLTTLFNEPDSDNDKSGMMVLEFLFLHRVLKEFGISSRVTEVPFLSENELSGYILSELNNGKPVFIACQSIEHAIVVTGHDPTGFYVNDPSTAFLERTTSSFCRGQPMVHVSYDDFKTALNTKWGQLRMYRENTLVITSSGDQSNKGYSLNFYHGKESLKIIDKDDPWLFHSPITSSAKGELSFCGGYRSGHVSTNGTAITLPDSKSCEPEIGFDGSDYIYFHPLVTNSDLENEVSCRLHFKIDDKDFEGSPITVLVPKGDVRIPTFIAQLRNLKKGYYAVDVELRSVDDMVLYDSWKFNLRINNEFWINVPQTEFTATPRTITAGQSVQFTDQSTNSPTSWSWNFGDGGTSTLRNPSHTYNTTGTYTVRLTTTNSAGSDEEIKSNYITVTLPVIAPVTAFYGTPRTITAGQSVQFTDKSTNSPTSWNWNFGDGGTSTLRNPSHTYHTAGTYTVTLTAINSAGSDGETKTGYITINPSVIAPVAAFTGSPRTITAGQNVQFTDQSTNNPTSWSWSFGDGGTSTTRNPSHVYNTAGTFTVTLTATNSAGSDGETKTGYITVNPSVIAPVAAFTASTTTPNVGQSVQFSDQSTNNPTSWNWSFGDGGTSTSKNPFHTYLVAGIYTVTLTATNSAGSNVAAKSNYVTVSDYCVPEFISPSPGQIMDNGCTNQSDDIIWYFTWSECPGATMYNLYVKHTDAVYPAIDIETNNTDYTRIFPNSDIDNSTRFGWIYRIRAYINGNWRLWSQDREFVVEPMDSDCDPTISDIDGNVYNTVIIGTQTWMKENLKTTKFNDGSDIPLVIDNTNWTNLSTPAYCWYNNNEAYKTTFGALYNAYAVNSGKVCPTGWHVPTDEEWHQLALFLDPNAVYNEGDNYWESTIAGGKLKEDGLTHWQSPNTDATNEVGFMALPSGGRSYDGTFNMLYLRTQFWSSTLYNDVSNRGVRSLSNDHANLHRYNANHKFGFSIRCIKDN
ncbi:MAG: PKD domain-containing protein [Bacteroidales bacterium]|nr:PKD domain-containing protein [Bacteroidales bacterium]